MPPLWGWKIFFKHAIPTGLVDENPPAHAGGYIVFGTALKLFIHVAAAVRRQILVRHLTPAAAGVLVLVKFGAGCMNRCCICH